MAAKAVDEYTAEEIVSRNAVEIMLALDEDQDYFVGKTIQCPRCKANFQPECVMMKEIGFCSLSCLFNYNKED